MTEEQRSLCRNIVITPPRGVSQISKEEFLRHFPSAIEHGKLAVRLLEDACQAQNAEDLQCALIIGFAFGFVPEHLNTLRHLVESGWHYSHEDVVSALGELRTADAIGALFHATCWIPKSLEYDESRALAVKAIWALGKIPGAEAETKLETLTRSGDAILRKTAEEQLERRHKAGEG